MTEPKQTLSPAEWKSVSDYQIELSEKLQKASSRTQQVSDPSDQNVTTSEPGATERVA